MKKITRLAVVLIMAALLSVCTFAATPGINLLTGDTSPMTFDDMTTLPSTIGHAELSESPFEGEFGKVLHATLKGAQYSTVKFMFSPALDRNRPYRISFKAYKKADEGYGNATPQLWIMKNGTSGWQIAKEIGSFVPNNAAGWFNHDYTVTTFGSLIDKNTGAVDTTDISAILLEWAYHDGTTGTVKENVYFDDISIIPAYKVTYLDEDGTELKVTYESLTGSSFEPIVSAADANNGIIGWSKANDGTVDESIVLNNTDITLYAVYDNNLNFNLKANKTLLIKSGDVASLTTNLWHRNGVDGITVSYSVAEGASFVTLKDNGNGSATVTAKGEGMAKILCTASTGEKEELYVLCDYMTVETEEQVTMVPSIAASNWLYDHTGTTFDSSEGAWKVRKRTDVVKSDDGKGNIVYYNNGFLNKTVNANTSTYKYVLFKLKADRATNFQVAITLNGAWKYTYPSASATNGEYVTVCADINALASGGTAGSLVLGVTNHNDTVYIKDITLSNIPSYEPDVPEIKAVKVLNKVSEISEDMGTASVKAAAFSNKSSDVKVAWKSSSDCIVVKNDGNGNATLKAMSDGTATITAYVSGDETISESFNVTVSGQRQKQAVYDIRILFWGASTTKHAPSASIGWYGNWGMAASAEENDYVHKLVSYIEEAYYPSKVTFEIIANSDWDAAISPETDKNKDWSTNAKFVEMEETIKTFRPNIIMTAQTGNMQATADGDVAYNAYKQMYDMMFSYCPDAIIVAQYCGTWHSTMKEEFMARLGQNYSDKNFFLLHNDVAGVAEYLAPEFENEGVARHWGDKGHERVAKQCFALANPVIPAAIEPSYIYIPEEIEITGDTKVDEKGASLQLGIKVTPNDASSDVIWSVDNSNIAIISKDGVLSPLNNGTVVVTAKSAYNDKIFDTHTVVIKNQVDNFTLTYAAGTTDTVTGLPEADEYASGNYTLSTAIPLRDAYTFIGWGLTENAKEAVTTVEMKKPTTVYALWKKTDGFEFEEDFDEAAGFIYGFNIENGFHNNTNDSFLNTTCTMGQKVTFKTPVLDIDADLLSIGLTSSYTDETGKVEVTVKYEGGEKIFVYPLTSTSFTTYVADISDITCAVTGVEIYVNAVPANNSMFDIGLDYVRFVPARDFDKTSGEFVISDGSVYISSANYSGYTAISETAAFDGGNDELLELSLRSGYTFRISGTDCVYVKGSEGAIFSIRKLSYENGSYDKCESAVYSFADGEIKEDSVVSRTLTSYDSASFRTKHPEGIRVKASVTKDLYTNNLISEYGFVVAKKENITNGKIIDVILDEDYITSKYVVSGKAYSKEENIHKIFNSTDTTEFFTAVLINVPKSKENFMTELVFRPYVKYNGYIIYGAKIETTIYDVARLLYLDEGIDAETLDAAKEILELCGFFDDAIYVPGDGLFD